MMSMKKTVFGSLFATFEEDSIWYDCVFNKEEPISPKKKEAKWVYERKEWDFSKCDKISIIQIQQDNNKFLIEYVILEEGDKE